VQRLSDDPSHDSHTVMFMVKSLELAEHLSDLTQFFDSSDFPTSTSDFDQSAVLSSDADLPSGLCQKLIDFGAASRQWERGLPASLALPNVDMQTAEVTSATHSMNRQAVVLRARLLYSQIVAYRPLLLYYSGSARHRDTCQTDWLLNSPRLNDAIIQKTCIMCTDAAIKLVSTLAWVARTDDEALPESWYTIFYLYNCGMILLLQRNLFSGLADAEAAWSKCIELLQSFQHCSRTAVRCTKLLFRLSDRAVPLLSVGGPQATMTSRRPETQTRPAMPVGRPSSLNDTTNIANTVDRLSQPPAIHGLGSFGNVYGRSGDVSFSAFAFTPGDVSQSHTQQMYQQDEFQCPPPAVPADSNSGYYGPTFFDDSLDIDMSWLSTIPFDFDAESLDEGFIWH
jgi:hypothetical protein